MSIAGVVLAAGASTRLGAPKQLLVDEHDETLVHRAARLLLEASCTPVFVIVGASGREVTAAVSDLAVLAVDNAEWPEGLASSIKSAVVTARAHTTAIDALLLSTCDMPTVDAEHLRAMSTAYVAGAPRVASRYVTREGIETVGIPAIIRAVEWTHLDALQGDRGAKQLFDNPGTVTVPLTGGAFDLDSPLDIDAWRRR